MDFIKSTAGVFHIPMLFAIFFSFLISMGFHLLFQEWKSTVEIQKHLDECIAKGAFSMKDWLEQTASKNREIKILRAAIASSSYSPVLQKTLQAKLLIASAQQNSHLLKWKLKKTAWLMKMDCLTRKDDTGIFPDSPWITQAPDTLGPQPLIWPKSRPFEFKITLSQSSRKSHAHIHPLNTEEEGNSDVPSKWKAKWTSSY